MSNIPKFAVIFFLLIGILPSEAQEANYDESKIPNYTLPELLIDNNGNSIQSVKDWEEIRRPEILQLFKDEMYGNIPDDADLNVTYETLEEGRYLDDISRKQVKITFEKEGNEVEVLLLI